MERNNTEREIIDNSLEGDISPCCDVRSQNIEMKKISNQIQIKKSRINA